MAPRTSSRKAARGKGRASGTGLDGSETSESRSRRRIRTKGTASTSASSSCASAIANNTKNGESSAISGTTASTTTTTTTTSSTATARETAHASLTNTGDVGDAPISGTIVDAATSFSSVSHGESGNDTITNHPPDCQCYLRRLNKSLFLPPSLMMHEMEDDVGAKR